MAKRRKRFSIKKTIIFTALAVGAVTAAVFLIKSLGLATALRSLPFSSGEKYAFTGKGFAYISKGRLNYFDLSDEDKNYSKEIKLDSVCAGEKITVVHNSRALWILGTPYNVEVNGTVLKICCGANYVAVLRRGDDESLALRVFDSTGAQCYQPDLKNGILVDFGFENGASPTLWTSQLVTAGDSFTATVTTYDLSRKSVTGVFSVPGQLVKNVFITRKSIFLICTDNIIRYDRSTNNESYRILTYGYECLSASFTGGKGRFVLKNKAVGSYIVRLLALNEDEAPHESCRLITLPRDTLASVVMNGRFIAVSPAELTIYEINDRKKELISKHVTEFEKPVDAVLKLSETLLMLTAGDEQLLYSVK